MLRKRYVNSSIASIRGKCGLESAVFSHERSMSAKKLELGLLYFTYLLQEASSLLCCSLTSPLNLLTIVREIFLKFESDSSFSILKPSAFWERGGDNVHIS